jgi:hypothetical protein
MPDFDKDLIAPVERPKPWDLPPQVRPYTAKQLLDGGADYAHTDNIFDKLDLASKNSKYEVGEPVTYGQLQANQRYDAFNPTIDNMEDFAAYGQSTVDKAINGILKGTNLAATTVAGGFGMVGGAIKWALPGGKFSDIWDNSYMRTLDDWNTKVDQEFLPNYYTDAEKNAEWYSTTNWMTSNFLFDKLIKNAGFAVGAMVGGNIANAALKGAGAAIGSFAAEGALLAEGSQAFQKLTPLLRNASRAFSAGKNIEAAAVLESQISSIADLSAKSSALGKIAQTTNKFANFGQQARRIGIAGYSTGGEASFEALQTSKEYRNNLIEQYRATHGGEEPSGDALTEINTAAESVGATSFLGNLAILGVTEYFQLPKLLGSSYAAEKQAANSLLGRVGAIELTDAGYAAAKGATTRFGKLAEKIGGVGKYVFDPKEAAQENLQYALQVGTQNYYNKAYRTNDADVLIDGVLHGFMGRDKEGKAIGSLISKEGIESAILGGITGGLMQARGTYQQGKAEENNTQKFLTLLNGAPEFKSAFMDRMNSINRDVVLQQQKQAAVIQGDKLEAKDLETDQMHNYLATRIKYGRFDMVKEDIAELRRNSSTEEGLAELKEEGIANVNDTIESYQNRLSNFERVADYTHEIYKAADLRYSGETNEDGSRKYSPELIDKMVYASAKITDYDLRIPSVNATLASSGINTFDVLASIIQDGKPNKTATKEALKQINDLDVISEVKDRLKTALSDVVEMSLRRKLYMKEYDAMKADPDTYTVPDEELESQFARAKQLTVDEEGNKKTVSVDLEVGKEYSLREPVRREGNTLQLAPKLTILSKTLGGELEVKLPNGEVTFFKPEEFKNYALSSADNTSAELADMLNKAITDVLGRKEFAGVIIPEGVSPLEFLNTSNNKALADAVQLEFAKKSEEYLRNQAEELAKKEKIQAIADKVNQFQTEVAKNSGTVGTDAPSLEQEVATSAVTMNKIFTRLFTSTTGPGEGAVLKPHQVRFNSFLNNAKNFKNRGKLQAIMFTYKQQKALGLDGLIEMAWNTEPGKLDIATVTNPEKGNVMVAFIQVDKNGKQSFVDANGNAIGEVGQPVDINKMVFSTMPTSLTYSEGRDANGNITRTNRYRAGEEQQAEEVAKAWQVFRNGLFAASENEKRRYGFNISKGIPIINKAAPEKNSVGEVLVPEDKISTQEGLVQVPTTGNIAHEDGENYKFPNGRPVLVYGDTLQFINNSLLTNKKATAVYNLLKELSDTLNSVAKSDKPLTFDPKKMAFLQNVLFWDPSGKSAESANKIYINDETGDLHIGDKIYDFANIDKSKDAIMAQLQTVYHNVNNKTLSLGLAQKFYEYTETGAVVEWPNYQSYLLSGKGRSVNETPLTTSVSKPTDAVPYSYNQKYAYFEGIDLPYEIVTPTPATQKEGIQVYPTQNFGNVNYTVVVENGEPQVTVPLTDNPAIDTIAKNPKTLVTINDALTQLDLFDDLDTAEESVAKFLANQIKASLVSAKPAKQAPAVEEVVPAPVLDNEFTLSYNPEWTVSDEGDLKSFEYTDKTGKIVAQGIFSRNEYGTNILSLRSFEVIEKNKGVGQKIIKQIAKDNPDLKLISPYNAQTEAAKNMWDALVRKNQAVKKENWYELTAEEVLPTPVVAEPVVTVAPVKTSPKGTVTKFSILGEDNRFRPENANPKDSDVYYGVDEEGDVFMLAPESKLPRMIYDFRPYIGRLYNITVPKPMKLSEGKGVVITELPKVDSQGNLIKKGKLTYTTEQTIKYGVPQEEPRSGRPQPKYRRVGRFGAKAMSTIDMEAFKQWAADKLPVMPYEFLDNIIRTHDGKAAWGVFEKGVAKIFKGAARGTEYHEAFHFVFQGFLSPSEQQAIFDEFRNKKGTFLDTASGKKIDYADATDLQIEERVADDFADFRLGKLPARTLGESIRRFFKAIVDFFKSFVNNPSLKDDLFNSIETGEFRDKAYPNAVVDKTAVYKQVPGVDSEQMVNDFVQDITANIFLNIFQNNKSLFKPEGITSAELFTAVKDELSQYEYYDQLSDEAWDALFDKTKLFLKKYKIEFDEDSRVTINDETADRNSYAAETFSINYKKSSPYAVKLLVGTLIKTKPLNQTANTSLEEPEFLENSVDGFQLVPYGESFSTLLNTLQNTKDVNQFVDKLVSLAKEKSEYVRLFKRLGGSLETGKINFGDYSADDWRLFTNFFQVFTKQKPGAIKQFRDGLSVYSGSANQATAANQLENEWTEAMIALADNPESLVSRGADKFYKVDQKQLEKLPIRNKGEMVTFLEKLGVNYPLAVYNKLKGKQLKEFADAVASIKLGLTQAPDNVRKLKGDQLDINKGLGKLASLYVATNGTNLNTTFYNAEGKQQQEFTDNNAPSYFESVFNSVETLDELMQKMPQLQDVFSVNSQILKKGGLFFDAEGDRIESNELNVNFIVGDENKLTNEGKSTSSLSIGDRMTLEINQNLDGNYYILIPADGSTEWMMNMGNQVSYQQFALGEGMNDVYKIFEGYLKDEIALAQDAENRKKLNNVGNKATELRFFKDILSGSLLQKVNGLIKSNASVTKIDAFLNKDDNRAKLNDAVKEFIDGTVAESKALLLNNSQIENTENGGYKYEGLDTSFTKVNNISNNNINEAQLTNILTFANANYAINNIEYHKILFGDPYQFKIKDGNLDETKRIKSFLSPRRFTFNTPEFNTFLNQDMNKAGNIQLTDKDYGFHQFKDYLKTFTAKDVNIVGSISKLFPAYAKVDEADASSWITGEAYREVKMKNGQWSDEAEAFYQWQMAYTRQELAKKGDYTYENDALKKHDAKLMRDQPNAPEYYIEVLKPIVSGNKFAKNNIDLVLDKFSQLPIFYSAVKGTNLENLYMQMFEGGYDYAVVESGRKVGAEGLHDLYTKNGDFNKEVFNNTVEVPWTSYGIQVENSYEKEKLQTRGSQLTKLATVDLYSNGEAINPEIDAAVKKNTEILNQLTVAGYIELINKLGIKDLGDGYMVFDKTAVAETLRQQILTQELSDNAIDSVTLDPETGDFVVPFEASTNYIQIKNILYSVVNKSIIRTKMSGFPGTQVSASMWENAAEGRKLVMQDVNGDWTEISKEEFEDLSPAEQSKVQLTSSALKFYTKEEPWCEVLLPNWMKKQFGNMSEEKILEYLDTDEGRKILSGIGFRIPTQALSSVEVFKVKGFLPEYMGRTVVVPSEITKKAGSDFDIDKLNMYLKATYVDANGNVRLIEYKGSEEATKDFYGKVYDQINAKPEAKSQLAEQYGDLLKSLYVDELIEEEVIDASKDNFVDKMYKRSLENEYYASLEKILTFPENFDRLLNPNTDATLKELSAKMDKLEGINESAIKNKMIDRNYLTQLRQSFITAKKWVGIAAVNITGNSLVQKAQIYFKDGSLFLPHNAIEVEGRERMTLSNSKDKANKYISDKLSEYANAFVDVAKDPYILKLIYSNRVVGSFMVLERLGVPTEDVAMFMNQPIIKKYIQYLDSINAGANLQNKENLAYIHSLFPAVDSAIAEAKLDAGKLADNIETYAKSKGKASAAFNAEQRALLKEFLKVTEFASQNFEFTQAINYDTTSFSNADELDKKQLRTDLAKFGNISSVTDILKTSFIGDQKTYLDKASDALGTILKFNESDFRGVIKAAIKAYAANKYMKNDKFSTVAEKLNASFLDYIIETKGNIDVAGLTTGPDSVAARVELAKAKYPQIKILQQFAVQTSENLDGGAKTIRLKNNIKDAYDENLHISYMKEMRNYPSEEVQQLYKDIVKLSIVQGTYMSSVSIKNIIPLQDYADVVAPIMNNLVVDEDVRNFAKLAMFERNSWKGYDAAVVKYVPTFWKGKRDKTGRVVALGYYEDHEPLGRDAYGKQVYQWFSPTVQEDGVLRVFPYGQGAGDNVIAIDRIVRTKKQGLVDFVTGRTITPAHYKELKEKLGDGINKVFGYQRVDDLSGNPVIDMDDKGVGYFIYKPINLLGDGKLAFEHKLFPTKSVFNNNTEIVENELAYSAIIAKYGDAYSQLAFADSLLDNNLVTVDFLKFNKEFQGTVVNFVNEIATTKETPVAMRNIEKGKEIQIVEGLIRDKFDSKAWTKPATQSDGSQATALPADQFKSFNEFLTFALLHEKAHEYILKDENETIGQYEDRINQEGLAKLAEIVGPSESDLGLDDDLTTEDFKC